MELSLPFATLNIYLNFCKSIAVIRFRHQQTFSYFELVIATFTYNVLPFQAYTVTINLLCLGFGKPSANFNWYYAAFI